MHGVTRWRSRHGIERGHGWPRQDVHGAAGLGWAGTPPAAGPRPAARATPMPAGSSQMRRGLSAAQWTVLLSCTLVVGSTALNIGASSPRILDLGVPQVVIIPFLMAMFLVAELFLMNVEFRRQAYSLTMAG